MHEYHIVENAVKTILEEARRAKALRVTRVTLVLGELSGFAEPPVRLYFENLSKDTVLENAELVIRHQPAVLACTTCNKSFPAQKRDFLCPACGSPGSLADAGPSLYAEDIEIETCVIAI